MRWSQDAWTVWGIASHEAAWQVLQAGASPNWQLELIESTPTIWPPGALEGIPAWRYQIRLHAQGTDRTGAQGGAP
jgi:hypothetical protein